MNTNYSKWIDQLNSETREHSFRVAKICSDLAPDLGLNKDIAYKIGYLHDVGKLYIPSRIMKKNGKLTSFEREIIDFHAYYGYRMVKDAGEDSIIYMPILFHHGYWNPKPYVSSDDVMDEHTIRYVHLIHSVDVFDAMSSVRVYHTPFSKRQVMNALRSDILATPAIIDLLESYQFEQVYHSSEMGEAA